MELFTELMKRTKHTVFLILGLILGSAAIFSQSASAFEIANCFEDEGGYYNFQNGVIFENFHTERATYKPAQEVEIDYAIKSNQKAPIVDAFTRVQILYMDPIQGEQIVDEFFPNNKEKLYLRFGDFLDREIRWKVPEGAKSGEYTAKIYLLSGKYFNLAGLSFIPYGPPGVPGEQTKFQIVNKGIESRIYFDKGNTWLNDEKYEFSTFAPVLESSDSLKVRTTLINEGSPKTADVNFEVYGWDDVAGQPILSKVQQILLGENGKQEIEFDLPNLGPGAYEIKFTATYREEKSILKIRFGISGEKARLIYAGINDFPLFKGKDYTLFICTSNSADRILFANASFEIKLLDENNNEIFREKSEILGISPQPTALHANFLANKFIRKGKLLAFVKDDKGNVIDSAELLYDYSKFPHRNAELSITTEKNTFGKGEEISYKVALQDNTIPLEGKILVELRTGDGKTIYAKTFQIDGTFNGKIDADIGQGDYKLIARELTNDLYSEKGIGISQAVSEEKPFKRPNILIFAILLFGIILIAILIFRFKKM